MLPDFAKLKVFFFVYRYMSVVEAASHLNITQSAVSQSLGKLESELRLRLFTRMHKKLVPTREGENLFNIVRPFVEELEMGVQNLQRSREVPSGVLSFGAPTVFGQRYFPEIMKSYRDMYPDVSFRMELGDPAKLLPLVENGQLDFAYTDLFSITAQSKVVGNIDLFSILPVVDEEVALVCSKDYYDMHLKKDCSYKKIISCDFIIFKKSALEHLSWIKKSYGKSPASVSSVLEVDSLTTVLNAVKCGLGLGITALHLVAEELQRGEIVRIGEDSPSVVNSISLVQLMDKVPVLAEKTFISHVQSEIEKSVRLMNG